MLAFGGRVEWTAADHGRATEAEVRLGELVGCGNGEAAGGVITTGRFSCKRRSDRHSGIQIPKNQKPQLL